MRVQKFLAEQVLYGRNTIEGLVDYFCARKNDLIKRTVNPLLEVGVLRKEDGTLRFSWEGVDEAFLDSGGEDLLLGYVRRVQGERQKSKKLYRSGLLMSQCLHRLHPPGVSGEPFEERGVFPVGCKSPGERFLH
jgi:hypothetical protein